MLLTATAWDVPGAPVLRLYVVAFSTLMNISLELVTEVFQQNNTSVLPAWVLLTGVMSYIIGSADTCSAIEASLVLLSFDDVAFTTRAKLPVEAVSGIAIARGIAPTPPAVS